MKMTVGRRKIENPKKNVLHIRLTDAEFDEIKSLAKKLKLSKSELILRGIRTLSQIQPVYYRVKPKKIPKNSEGIIAED